MNTRQSQPRTSGSEWLALVPPDRAVMRLRRVLKVESGDFLSPDDLLPEGIPVFGGNGLRGFFSRPNTAADTLLIGRVGALCGNVHHVQEPVWATEHAFRVRKLAPFNTRFMFYVLTALDLNRFAIRTAQPLLNSSIVADQWFAAPRLSEQADIAEFLDRETARIDALVAKQKAFLGALDEQRRSLVSNVVATGLRTGAAVETGIEVFPRLPQHWTVRRLKHLIQPGTSISYGIVQPGPHLPGGVPFVQTADLTKRRFSPDDLQHTEPEIAAAYPRSRLRVGDVMLGIRASVGDAALVPDALDGANLSRGIARIVPGRNITAAFLVHSLSTPQAAWFWSLNMQGSTFREVSIETVRELPVPVPPLDEQAEIVARLDAALGQHDALRARATEMIERLREHRAALITAAVTGGIAAAGSLADQGPAKAAAA